MESRIACPTGWLFEACRKHGKRLVCASSGGGTGHARYQAAISRAKELKYPLEQNSVIANADTGGSSQFFRKRYRIFAVGDLGKNMLAAGPPYLEEQFDLFRLRFPDIPEGRRRNLPLGTSFVGNSGINALVALAFLRWGLTQETADRLGRILKLDSRFFPATLSPDVLLHAWFRPGEGFLNLRPDVEEQFKIEEHLKEGRFRYLSRVEVKRGEINPAINDLGKRGIDLWTIAPGSVVGSTRAAFVPGMLNVWRTARRKVIFVNHSVDASERTAAGFINSLCRLIGFTEEDMRGVIFIANTSPIPDEWRKRYAAEHMVPTKLDWGQYEDLRNTGQIIEVPLLKEAQPEQDPNDPIERGLVYDEELIFEAMHPIWTREIERKLADVTGKLADGSHTSKEEASCKEVAQ